jgi:cytochrome P450
VAIALADLNLPHLPMETAEFAADPFPYFVAARKKHPWLATSIFGPVLTEYQAMKALFSQDDKMRFCLDKQLEVVGVTDTVFGRNALLSVMGSQAERHRHLRETYAPAFTPRHVNELRPLIRAALEWLLEDRAPRGDFDFYEFATWLPVAAMFAILGVPAERIAEIKPDLDSLSLSASLRKELVPAIDAATLRLMSFVRDLIESRRDNPPADGQPDFLGTLVAARDQGNWTTSSSS